MQAIHPLADWIDARMSRSAFAEKVGTSEPHLSLVLKRKRGISLELAIRIEDATDGEMTAAKLLEASGDSRKPSKVETAE